MYIMLIIKCFALFLSSYVKLHRENAVCLGDSKLCARIKALIGLHVRAVPISHLQAYTCIYCVHLTLVSISILNLTQYSLHVFKFGACDLYACTNWLVQTSQIDIEVSSIILWKPCGVDFHDHLFTIIFFIVITAYYNNNIIIMRTVLPAHVCICSCGIDYTF